MNDPHARGGAGLLALAAPDLRAAEVDTDPPPGVRRRPVVLKPGWCLTAMLALLPLWWVLGLASFVYLIMAVPMAVALLRRRPIAVPPGFGWWMLFLLWSLVGFFLLGVNPPGTVSEPGGDRLIGYFMRQSQYLSGTVILLYVGNLTEREMPQRKVVRLIAWVFCVTAAGGVAGTLIPRFEFTSLFEMVLPGGIRSHPYVKSLVHPSVAQVQDFFGQEYPRPKAPYDYTNAWGFMMVLLAIFFVVAAFSLAERRRPILSGGLLAIGGVTLILSLNRGTWVLAALAVMVVAVRLALWGRTRALVGIAAAALVVLIIVALSPLKGVIMDRLDEGKSNAIREQTTEQTVELVSQAPLTGFGTTRSALGSSQTITAGRSSSCPACGNAVIGSNGYLYKLLVSTGVVGAAFFYLFFLVNLWRARRDHSPIAAASFVAIVITLVAGFFYDALPDVLAYPMLAVALLWRAQRDAGERSDQVSGDAVPTGVMA